MTALLDGLNEAQRRAVTAADGPVLVLAGPGSGKTRVLTRRIAWLVQEKQINPQRIMAVTFTNRAAKEMNNRVEDILGSNVTGMMLGTFHSICARILRREAGNVPLRADYVIYDTADQLALIKEVVTTDLDLDDKRYKPRRVLNAISTAKNEAIPPEKYVPEDYFGEIISRAYVRYQERLITNNAADFDDLIMYVVQMLKNNAMVREKYQRIYQYILVDEFQDTNGAQYALVKLFAGGTDNLFCVGDEDQSIYRWRGADYRNIERLKKHYPGLQMVLLEQNYRSTQPILDAATSVIKRNTHRTHKKLFTSQDGGPLITVYEAHNEQFEADYIIEQIGTMGLLEGIEPGQCAIMYRTNAQSRVLEEVFIRRNMPYRLVGATRFYGRKEIKDMLAYLRVVHNPDDAVSLRRIINMPPRGIGAKTLETFLGWANSENISLYNALEILHSEPQQTPLKGRARNALDAFYDMLSGWRSLREEQTVPALLNIILDETNYKDYINDGTQQAEDRLENIIELVRVTHEFEELPLSTFLEEVSLVSDVDGLSDEVNAPTLMTLHAAKGLEFDAVFITGLEETILPHSRALEDAEEMAEERRLMYVGMTRARRHLHLVYSFRRSLYGESIVNQPSRFIQEIPKDLMVNANANQATGMGYQRETTWRSQLGYQNPAKKHSTPPSIRKDQAPQQQFRAGQRVYHAKFGEGIVISSKVYGRDEEISVAFDGAGIKRLMASFANLERLEG